MPDSKKPGPQDPNRIELSPQLLEAVLANRAKTLKPIADMLGGFYANLLCAKVPEQLASLCVLRMLDGILAQWLLLQKEGVNHAPTDPPAGDDLDM